MLIFFFFFLESDFKSEKKIKFVNSQFSNYQVYFINKYICHFCINLREKHFEFIIYGLLTTEICLVVINRKNLENFV